MYLASTSGVTSTSQAKCLEDYINGGGNDGRPVEVGGKTLEVRTFFLMLRSIKESWMYLVFFTL